MLKSNTVQLGYLLIFVIFLLWGYIIFLKNLLSKKDARFRDYAEKVSYNFEKKRDELIATIILNIVHSVESLLAYSNDAEIDNAISNVIFKNNFKAIIDHAGFFCEEYEFLMDLFKKNISSEDPLLIKIEKANRLIAEVMKSSMDLSIYDAALFIKESEELINKLQAGLSNLKRY